MAAVLPPSICPVCSSAFIVSTKGAHAVSEEPGLAFLLSGMPWYGTVAIYVWKTVVEVALFSHSRCGNNIIHFCDLIIA